MLNGIDPIIMFQLYKILPPTAATLASVPLTSQAKQRATYAIIPIYLSESISGLYIDTESKSIDVDTNMESLTSGSAALINQKILSSITTVNMVGVRNSLGLTMLLSLAELLIDKVTSGEYELTYMHNSVNVFGGLIHSFSHDNDANSELIKIKLEISRGRPKTKSVVVMEDPTAGRLGSTGATPPAGAPTVPGTPAGNSGTSAIQPGVPTGGLL